MRSIKKLFKFNKVEVTDSKTGEVLDTEMISGETNKAKVMTSRIKQGKTIEGIVISIGKVNETRVMSGEDFYKNSTLVVEPTEVEGDEEPTEETTEA